MTEQEARECIEGKRTNWDNILSLSEDRGLAYVHCLQADTAMVECAYWVLKAHKEGLMSDENGSGQSKKRKNRALVSSQGRV